MFDFEPRFPTEHIGEVVNGHTIPDQFVVTQGRGVGVLAERMGVYFIELTPEYSLAVMPVEGNTQPIGLMHGGAYCVLGEAMGSVAANLHAWPKGGYAVGTDINATHTGSASRGWVTGECRSIQLGGTMTVHEIVISDAAGRRCSTVRITNLIRRRPEAK